MISGNEASKFSSKRVSSASVIWRNLCNRGISIMWRETVSVYVCVCVCVCPCVRVFACVCARLCVRILPEELLPVENGLANVLHPFDRVLPHQLIRASHMCVRSGLRTGMCVYVNPVLVLTYKRSRAVATKQRTPWRRWIRRRPFARPRLH